MLVHVVDELRRQTETSHLLWSRSESHTLGDEILSITYRLLYQGKALWVTLTPDSGDISLQYGDDGELQFSGSRTDNGLAEAIGRLYDTCVAVEKRRDATAREIAEAIGMNWGQEDGNARRT